MIAFAEELVGQPLVYALAQVPFTIGSGNRIATLAPLMILETGEIIPFSNAVFPTDGYVFWWDVPAGNWQPGDLVIGRLRNPGNTGRTGSCGIK